MRKRCYLCWAKNSPHIEYVVIDGNSTDGSVGIIRRYASDLTYWVSEPDHGQANAINKGFAHTTGDILGWLNSDDILLAGALSLVGEIFARYPQIAWVTGICAIIDTEIHIDRILQPCSKDTFIVKRGWYHGHLPGIYRPNTFGDASCGREKVAT